MLKFGASKPRNSDKVSDLYQSSECILLKGKQSDFCSSSARDFLPSHINHTPLQQYDTIQVWLNF